jgi:hypothetical protein
MSEKFKEQGSAFKLEARASEKRTIEEWALQKQMLPEKTEVPGAARLGSRTIAGVKPNPKYVLFAQAKALRGWPQGREVTEQEFDEAIAEGQGTTIR